MKTYLHRLWSQLTREPVVLIVIISASLLVVVLVNYGVDDVFLALAGHWR